MHSASATNTFRPRPISGWALDPLIACDAAQPGLLRFTLQASSLRRQAIFLTLSHLHGEPADLLASRLCSLEALSSASCSLQSISNALMTPRVRDIVRALHPGAQGLVGALSRIGDDPLSRQGYRTLVRLLSSPDGRGAKVLHQLRSFSEATLSVVQEIDPAFLHSDLVSRFRSIGDVEQFNCAVDLIRHIVPNATDEELLTSLKALAPTSGLDAWAQRWVARGMFPDLPPFEDDEDWAVLRTGEAMREVAGRFRNCLREKVHVTALGRAAFVEWRREPGAVVELAALSTASGASAWLLEGIYGHRNSRVDQQTASAICRKLQQVGVLLPAKLGHAQRHNKAAPLLDVYEFDGIAHLEAAFEEEVEGIIEELAREAAA